MTQSLISRYQEYSRRKLNPFRATVVHGKKISRHILGKSKELRKLKLYFYIYVAYKTVLHSYGLESNPGSEVEDGGSDLEVMDVSYRYFCRIIDHY